LIDFVALAGSKRGTCATDGTAATVASIGVIAECVLSSHDSLALLIAACALSRGTLKSVATTVTVGSLDVRGAEWRSARTSLLGVADASTRAADGRGRRELAAATTVFIAIVTNRASGELARSGVAAAIVSATRRTTTVAIFALFNNSITTNWVADGYDAAIVRQAGAVDSIPRKRSTNVADRAKTEGIEVGAGGRIHDVFCASITLCAA
jgi:hypothetical protein